MKNKILNRFLAILLLIMILPSLFSVPGKKIVYANTVEGILDDWVDDIDGMSNPKFYNFSYTKDSTVYNAFFMKVVLPGASSSYPRIIYKYSSTGSISFICEEMGDNGKLKSTPLELDVVLIDGTDSNGEEIRRSMLKRQAANNFNSTESKYGYLLEISDIDVFGAEGKEIRFVAQIDAENGDKIKKEIKLLDEGWTKSQAIKVIDQGEESEGFFATLWKWLTDAVGEVMNLLESLINSLFLALADGIFSAICAAVGEEVTIDKVVFGQVGKLSINFWDGTEVNGAQTNVVVSTNSVMSLMKDVVNSWYNVFLTVAIAVYLVALLIVGIKILLASTGESKAKYKEVFQSWITGVMILFLFPLVMKYTVKLNNVLIEMLYQQGMNDSGKYVPTPDLDEATLENISTSFGEDNFIASIRGDAFEASTDKKQDMMFYIRELAGNLGQMSLTFVYFVLLGELIVILVVYYKRVFMMAFLITIFPIVAIMYIIEKLGSGNSHSLSSWMKEYMVLIFTQSFHATVYIVVVQAGVRAYIKNDNWLFMLMCIIFLFQGEKILRSIFGMKSSTGAIKDLAAAGTTAFGFAKRVPEFFKGGGKSKEDKDDRDLKEAENDVKTGGPTLNHGNTNPITRNDLDETNRHGVGGASSDSSNREQTAPEEITNRPENHFATAQSAVIAQALGNRTRAKGKGKRNALAGAATKVLNVTSKATAGAIGGMIGAAAGLATGNVGQAMGGAIAGAAVGAGAIELVKKPIRGMTNAYQGKKLKRKILAGGMDDEFRDLGFDLASMDTEKQAMFRQALADLGAKTTTKGKDIGELRMLKTADKINRKRNR